MAVQKKYISLNNLTQYDEKIKKVITDGDAAALASAKAYADGLAVNYDGAGSAASALAEAKTYADGKDAAITAAKTAGDNAQAAIDAYKIENDKAVADIEETVAALDEYVGEIPEGYEETNVIAYIGKKAQETLVAATGDGGESAASVKQALDTFKAEINPKVTANAEAAAAAKTAADDAQASADSAQEYVESFYNEYTLAKVALEGADEAQVARIATLETQITGLTGAMHFRGVVETNPSEITEGYVDGDVVVYGEKEYVWNDGAFVEFGDVSAEGERIATLEGEMDAAEGKIATLEGQMTAANNAIATKAEKSYVDTAVEGLGEVDAAQLERIVALESAVGESGSVAEDIATAKQEAIDAAKSYTDTQDGVTLGSAKTYADGLNTSMDTRVKALEAIDHDHANKAELDLVKSGDVAKWDGMQAAAEATAAAALATAKTELEGKITAAQTAAETKATEYNTAMDARMTAVENWQTNMVECDLSEINALFA